jgi:hypothetical protein
MNEHSELRFTPPLHAAGAVGIITSRRRDRPGWNAQRT